MWEINTVREREGRNVFVVREITAGRQIAFVARTYFIHRDRSRAKNVCEVVWRYCSFGLCAQDRSNRGTFVSLTGNELKVWQTAPFELVEFSCLVVGALAFLLLVVRVERASESELR